MKSLKWWCIKKLVDTYKIGADISSTDQLDYLLSTFQNLSPCLSDHVFSKFNLNEHADFENFIWFLHHFVWNFNFGELRFKITDYSASILTNWIKEKDYSEVSVLGYDYLGSKMIFAFKKKTGVPVLKEADNSKVNQMFESQPIKRLIETEVGLQKLLRLTVFNSEFLSKLTNIFPMFFDLKQGTVFNFYEMLKVLGFPGFKCNYSQGSHIPRFP